MNETLQPRLGVELRRARMRLELTQEQVARAVGFVPVVYGRIERGDMLPSVPRLKDLCITLGVSANALLSVRATEGTPLEQPSTSAPDESPEFRRLTMLVRELPPDRLKLFRIVLQSLVPEED
jgi:transcriptional regulator with XRE-family HTH domain